MVEAKIIDTGALSVVHIPIPDATNFTLWVMVKNGSNSESKKQGGLAHFLEHMCFKGTESRPSPKLIAEELDGMGAQYNAYTSHEHIGFYIKTLTKNFDQALDILSDITLHSTFPEEELQKEKGVVIEEINMYRDDKQSQLSDYFLNLHYGDQSAGRPIIGIKENIEGFTREDVISFHQKSFVKENIFLVVSGNVPQDFLSKIDRAFSGTQSYDQLVNNYTQVKQEKRVSYKKTESDQAHLTIAFQTHSANTKEVPIARVLSVLLGGGMSSRIFVTLREELGLAYYGYTYSDLYSSHGLFGVDAGVDKNRIQEALDGISRHIKDVSTKTVPEIELQKVKNILQANMSLGLETTDSWARFYGKQYRLGLPIKTPLEISREIDSVQQDQIKAYAQTYLFEKNSTLAILSDEKSLNSSPELRW